MTYSTPKRKYRDRGQHNSVWTTNLLNATEQSDIAGVQRAIQEGAEVNCVNSLRDHPLGKACQRGLDDIVRILLDAGANTRFENSQGCSPIMRACAIGHLSIVEMLLHYDQELLEIANQYGESPLLIAAKCGRADIVRFLLDQGANVFAVDHVAQTALMHAVSQQEQQGNPDIVRQLLAAGLDLEARSAGNHKTALHYAVNSGRVETVRDLIVQHNANMFAVDQVGRTPFDDAWSTDWARGIAGPLLELYANKMKADHGRLALHELLNVAEYSFDVHSDFLFDDERDDFHPPLTPPVLIRVPLGTLTVTHWCTLLDSLDSNTMEQLIWNRDDSGKLPIHIACRTNAPAEILSVLLDLDSATLHVADHSGNLPLHECCCCCFGGAAGVVDSVSVRYLVEQGGVGTLAARNHQGALPLHVLCQSTNPSCRTVQFMIDSYSGSVAARTSVGEYPFMIAACDKASASLSVLYELVRANPDLVVPR